jgi:Arc/MetJ-type ribon-helix-helix transcriptional regulator
MGNIMKRKQFHLSALEEKILEQISKTHRISEAEAVRMAIRELGEKRLTKSNSLIEMSEIAQKENMDAPQDLSTNHDRYLAEIYNNER